MKQLRAEGIERRLKVLVEASAWLRSASKDDPVLHMRLREAHDSLVSAKARTKELLEERTSA